MRHPGRRGGLATALFADCDSGPPANLPSQGIVQMTTKIDTGKLAKILAMLSSEHDGQVISAARQATRIIREAGKTWADLLPKMPPAPGFVERVTASDGTVWAPPIGKTWRETARWLVRLQPSEDRREALIATAIASGQGNGVVTDPEHITPEIAETLTMMYRRIAGLVA